MIIRGQSHHMETQQVCASIECNTTSRPHGMYIQTTDNPRHCFLQMTVNLVEILLLGCVMYASNVAARPVMNYGINILVEEAMSARYGLYLMCMLTLHLSDLHHSMHCLLMAIHEGRLCTWDYWSCSECLHSKSNINRTHVYNHPFHCSTYYLYFPRKYTNKIYTLALIVLPCTV